MNNEINIWLPVSNAGTFRLEYGFSQDVDGMWNLLAYRLQVSKKELTAIGWSVQPFTLTKGHKP